MSETDEQRAERYAALQSEYPTRSVADHRVRSRRSVLTGVAAAAVGFAGWRWLQGQPEDMRIPQTLRDVHEVNESIWRRLYREDQLAPTFDPSESSELRVNGRRGIDEEIDLTTWSMTVLDRDGSERARHVMSDIASLPKTEMTVEHKCVEGWSHVVTWGGVTFRDFLEAYYPERLTNPTEYVSLATPNEGYYVGLEWDAMVHPQTLLCYELQGAPLSQDHGAPLRLTTPLKYGTKQIKRIGSLAFTDERPADYWTERGYDWYAGL